MALEMMSMVKTDSTGYSPIADSPLNIIESEPSNTALATSEASALVGLGEAIIDSSIWVAVITGLPISLAFFIICF